MAVTRKLWAALIRYRIQLLVALLIVSLVTPQPAQAQFGFLFSLISAVTSGMNTLNNVMTSINNALRNVIAPILDRINSTMAAVRQTITLIFQYQRDIVYPQSAIDRARDLVGQVHGIYVSIRGIWARSVASATLPTPQRLEAVIQSRDPDRIGEVGVSFSSVYTPLPQPEDSHPEQRDLIDSADAAAQAAMKRAIAIDAIADRELAVAEQMMLALESAAPGTADMIGAQAGAWLVRSHAYTQQALAELMRLRTVELAAQGARIKESARYAREARTKAAELNRR